MEMDIPVTAEALNVRSRKRQESPAEIWKLGYDPQSKNQ